MTSVPDVLVAEPILSVLNKVISVIKSSTGLRVQPLTENDTESILEKVRQLGPHVLVLGPSSDVEQVLSVSAQLAESQPESAVVLVVATLTTDLLKRAMKAGVSDVVAVSKIQAQLGPAVSSAYAAAQRYRIATTATGPGAGAKPAVKKAKTITVFGTKGGVGKTVVATNLGVVLSRDFEKRTVLVDLDLQFGDVAIMFQLAPDRTITDVAKVLDRMDTEMLDGFLIRHPCGLRILLAPVQPEDAEGITTGRVTQILDFLEEMFEYIVIDTPPVLNDTVLSALDRSDEILTVATMDVASVKNTKISLQKLRQLGYESDRISVVLNRADSKVWLQPSRVESTIGSSIICNIPSDRIVPRSVNKGVPVVIDAPRTAVAKSLVKLGGRLLEPEEGDDDVTE